MESGIARMVMMSLSAATFAPQEGMAAEIIQLVSLDLR